MAIREVFCFGEPGAMVSVQPICAGMGFAPSVGRSEQLCCVAAGTGGFSSWYQCGGRVITDNCEARVCVMTLCRFFSYSGKDFAIGALSGSAGGKGGDVVNLSGMPAGRRMIAVIAMGKECTKGSQKVRE